MMPPQQDVISSLPLPQQHATPNVCRWLHYLKECGQNESMRGFQPWRSSKHSKEHALPHDT